jgi:hypothetical protein
MEPQDNRTIPSFHAFGDIQQHVIFGQDDVASQAALQELAMLQPRLVDLQNFSDFFADKLGQRLDPGLFWGLLGVILTVRR